VLLQATTEELEAASDELDETVSALMLDSLADEELVLSVSVLLFPLSPPHAAKIKATATIPNNAIRCFIFFPCLRPWNRDYLG